MHLPFQKRRKFAVGLENQSDILKKRYVLSSVKT